MASGANLVNAFAAAQHGDTIVAGAGFYDVGKGIVTDKGMTPIGVPATRVYGTGGGPTIAVNLLPADRRLVAHGVDFEPGASGHPAAFRSDQNSGAVHRSKCRFIDANPQCRVADIPDVLACESVSLTDCETQPITVNVIGSNVQLARCTLVGHRARDVGGHGRAANHGLWAATA